MFATYAPEPTPSSISGAVALSRGSAPVGTARSTSPSVGNAPIVPHATGHAFARDGSLLRVDVMAGRWAATRYAPNLVVTARVFGTDEAVHRQIARWL
jgi:hypothetical protein